MLEYLSSFVILIAVLKIFLSILHFDLILARKVRIKSPEKEFIFT